MVSAKKQGAIANTARVSNLENGSNIRRKLGRKVTKQVELPSLVQRDNADINHEEEAMRELVELRQKVKLLTEENQLQRNQVVMLQSKLRLDPRELSLTRNGDPITQFQTEAREQPECLTKTRVSGQPLWHRMKIRSQQY